MTEKNKVHKVGEYRADYTPLTAEEMAATDPASDELFRNSKEQNLFVEGYFSDRIKAGDRLDPVTGRITNEHRPRKR